MSSTDYDAGYADGNRDGFYTGIENQRLVTNEYRDLIVRIESHLKGLVSTHSKFAEHASGSWSGKKQKVRAAEAAQILSFVRKELARLEEPKFVVKDKLDPELAEMFEAENRACNAALGEKYE